MKLIILFFMLTIQVSAQKLIFIPDINLRNELKKEGFVTNDSLDIRKTQGRLQLELNDKGIENLDGLQYFDQVWRLVIYNNKIKLLDNLPPNLTDLACSNNEIRLIDNLPINLKYLGCSNNKISNIKNLPPYLISLDFSNNSLKNMPLLPKTIQYINYSNNLIPLDSLSKPFQSISCEEQSQNCLPYELMNWRILNANVKDTSLKITGMTIKLNSGYSWGFGSQVEIINFKIKNSKLVANKMEVKRYYDKNVQPNKNDSSYYNNVNYSVEVSKINQFLEDIYSNKMLVQIQIGDSLKSINLKTKKNGITCFSDCSDCTGYNLQYIIYTHTDTINLNYGFDSGLSSGPTICSTNGPENIKSILDWLYIYRLTNLTFDKHEITKYYFNKINLDRVIKWAK
jgi:hypothetical protein